jgi:peptidoglycan/LPS O-acetylase OafA/YrhL
MSAVAPKTASGNDHLAPLDGLRGLAIALVIWFHAWQITWLRADVPFFGQTLNFNWICEDGFVGVDLFFFISGFCLFYPYVRTIFDGKPEQRFRSYAYRRAIKILPSYVFVIACSIALGWATFESPADELKQILLHLLFIHTFWDGSYGSINGVLWSLATEVQFYVVFPLVCWAALRRPWLTFAGLALVANLYRLHVAHDFDVVHEMDQLPGVLDLFGAGMLCAYLFRLCAVRAPRLAARRLLWTALALAGAAAFVAILQNDFEARLLPGWPMNWHVYGRPAMGAAFLALALGSMFAFPLWQRVLANPVLVFLSVISYNLYLWHQPVARALLKAHVPRWTGASEHDDPVWGLAYSAVALTAGIVVATIVTFTIERPLLRWKVFEPRAELADEPAPQRDAILQS